MSWGDKPVIVVGAGCAGPGATYALRKAGVEVVALEAAARLGGLCRSMRRNGFQLPLGAGFTEMRWATTTQGVDQGVGAV
ncbi:MAG: NAD(P)-binding protein [Actinomycetota bacterium]